MSQCLKSIYNIYSLCALDYIDEIIYRFISVEGMGCQGYRTLELTIAVASLPLPMGFEKKGRGTIKLNSMKRIGPHNIDILSLIIGSTLGDSHLEKRKGGLGTRVIFEQSNKNVEYLMWFHNYFAQRGYCNPEKPKLSKRIRKNNEVLFHYRFNSYTFNSFN